MIRFLIVFFFTTHVFAQEQLIAKSADRAFEQFAYSEALEKYQILHSRDSNNLHYLSRIGDSYLKLNDSQNAEIWLKKLVEKKEGFDVRFIYEYAQVLSKNKEYESAKYWYNQYRQNGGINPVDEKIDGIEKLSSFFVSEGKYTIEREEFNTDQSDFSPFFYEDGVAFVSAREERKWVKSTYNWDKSDYLDYYYFNPGDTSQRLGKIDGLNSKYHEGPAQMYAGNEKVVFTRNSVQESKLQRDQKGIANLQLYFGEKVEESLWKIYPYEHNSVEFSFGHPTITEDGNLLIFASDMPGGFGGTDLYLSVKDRSGNWSTPMNLGKSVNTSENEMFPFLAENRLWFASNGREGLGGLDIYWVLFENLQVSGNPTNIGSPINSSQDDFGLITSGNSSDGYFSSDRFGSDDVFSFISEFVKIEGQVLAKGSNTPISSARVTIKDPLGNVAYTTVTNDEGIYSAEIGKGADFTILAEKEQFLIVQPIIETTKGVSEFKKVSPLFLFQRILDVSAIDAETKDTIQNVVQAVKAISTNELLTSGGKSNQYQIEPNEYEIVSASEGYYTLRDTINVNDDFFGTKKYTAAMKKIVVGESIRLENIYYDVNSANLREESELELDKLVVFMMDNPDIKIELSSHTDSRGSAPYNQRLSQKRAESATDYLISHGISSDRIVPKGYGEQRLVNRCKDGVRCSADEHQENRRTEIQILESD